MPKSIFRQPGVKHYQLLHRSVRDPELEGSDRVLAEVTPVAKGKQRQTADQELAVEHGILYEDADEYDYGQHLREIGTDREAVFVEANTQQQRREKQKQNERSYAQFLGIPEASGPAAFGLLGGGLEPDMEPGLREVLEALDDDAYNVVDDAGRTPEDGDTDFFGQLLESGEQEDGDDDLEWVDDENELEDTPKTAWETEMAQYKAQPTERSASPDPSDEEDADTLGDLRKVPASHLRSRKMNGPGSAVGSNFSMSSSAMFRNQGLQSLDDRFDEVCLKHFLWHCSISQYFVNLPNILGRAGVRRL